MKELKYKKALATTIAVILSATVIAAFASEAVRHWLHEAFCYVFWSAVGLAPIVLFFLIPGPGKDPRDRSRDTVDWEMEQDRLREQREEEEWLEGHR